MLHVRLHDEKSNERVVPMRAGNVERSESRRFTPGIDIGLSRFDDWPRQGESHVRSPISASKMQHQRRRVDVFIQQCPYKIHIARAHCLCKLCYFFALVRGPFPLLFSLHRHDIPHVIADARSVWIPQQSSSALELARDMLVKPEDVATISGVLPETSDAFTSTDGRFASSSTMRWSPRNAAAKIGLWPLSVR